MRLLIVFSSDTSFKSSIIKGNFTSIKEQIESYLPFVEELFVISKDTQKYNIHPKIHHIPITELSPFQNCPSQLISILYLLLSFFKIIQLRVDIIRLYGINGLQFLFASRILQIPIVISYEYDWAYQISHINYRSSKLKAAIKIISKKITTIMISNSNLVLAYSDKLYNKAKLISNNNLELSSNYIGDVFYKERDIKIIEGIRVELNIPSQSKVLLSIGRFHKVKRIDIILSVLSRLITLNYPYHLILIGNGPEDVNIKNNIMKTNIGAFVSIINKIEYELLPNYYSLTDIFIITSEMEGQPRVVMEAMANGIPIIGSNVEGINDLVINNKNGFLCEIEDINCYVDKILILQDETIINRMKKKNLEQADNFKINKIIQNEIRLFNQLILD